MKVDAVVLGAGIVGVSVAIHLQRRGRSVALVDRREPGRETSFGNAGLIQREGVMPHAFPQNFAKLLRYGLNGSTDMFYHKRALPSLVPFLARYWWHSRAESYARISELYEPLIRQAISEHAPLIEAAGAGGLIEKRGWYKVFRTAAARDAGFAEADWMAQKFGIGHRKLTAMEMAGEEPDLRAKLAGALHWTDPWTIKDPGALVAAYGRLFEELGGRFVSGDAQTLAADGTSWRVTGASGAIEARDAVIALGPWAKEVARGLGYRLPLAVKRGYHMHYRPEAGATLRNWISDAEPGFLLAPMTSGIRLTTGAEFADRDAAPTPVQVERTEGLARGLFPLGERIDPAPWLGARPCTPDMMPIIGPAPRHQGLWFAFGHAHHGMTLGPATGRLIAEMVTGQTPFINPLPYSAVRFLH